MCTKARATGYKIESRKRKRPKYFILPERQPDTNLYLDLQEGGLFFFLQCFVILYAADDVGGRGGRVLLINLDLLLLYVFVLVYVPFWFLLHPSQSDGE